MTLRETEVRASATKHATSPGCERSSSVGSNWYLGHQTGPERRRAFDSMPDDWCAWAVPVSNRRHRIAERHGRPTKGGSSVTSAPSSPAPATVQWLSPMGAQQEKSIKIGCGSGPLPPPDQPRGRPTLSGHRLSPVHQIVASARLGGFHHDYRVGSVAERKFLRSKADWRPAGSIRRPRSGLRRTWQHWGQEARARTVAAKVAGPGDLSRVIDRADAPDTGPDAA